MRLSSEDGEDLALLRRVRQAPDRHVYHIDVGRKTHEDVIKTLKEIREKLKKRKFNE